MDVDARTVQLGVVHPAQIPRALAPLLPALPAAIPRDAVDQLVGPAPAEVNP